MGKILKTILFGAALLLLIIFGISFSAILRSGIAHNYIRQVVTKELETSLGREIIIHKVRGNLLTHVIFEKVTVAKEKKIADGILFSAAKIKINYNLIKVLITKGDIVTAISKIQLTAPRATLKRTSSDQLNTLIAPASLVATKPEEKAKPSPFRAKIVVKKGTVKFIDHRGFGPTPLAHPFPVTFKNLDGEFKFLRRSRLRLKVKGEGVMGKTITPFEVRGQADPQKNTYKFLVLAKNIDLATLEPYLTFIPNVKLEGGKANVNLSISSPKKENAFPPSFKGKITVSNFTAKVSDYFLRDTTGEILLRPEDITLKKLQGFAGDIPFSIQGKLTNLAHPQLDFTLNIKKTPFKKFYRLLLPIKDVDFKNVKGYISADLKVSGPSESLLAEGTANLDISAYNQPVGGQVKLHYKDKLLALYTTNVTAYQGTFAGSGTVDFRPLTPKLDVKAKYQDISLQSLVFNQPQFSGIINGEIAVDGDFSDFKVTITNKAENAFALGQPIEEGSLLAYVKDGDITLQEFSIKSVQAEFLATGSFQENAFDLKAETYGINLGDKTLLGGFQGTIALFKGRLRGKINEDLFQHPLRNLFAQGELKIKEVKVGPQEIDQAYGAIALDHGLLEVEDFLLAVGTSEIRASGKFGLEKDTAVTLSGKKINLADLKIIPYFLPPEFKDIKGLADIKITLRGEIPADFKLNTPEPLLGLEVSGMLSLEEGVVAKEKIEKGELNFTWQEKKLTINRLHIKTASSSLLVKGEIDTKQNLTFDINGSLDARSFRIFTQKYGKLSGKVDFESSIQGKIEEPEINVALKGEKIRFNEISLDHITGKVKIAAQTLTLVEPLTFEKGSDAYRLEGKVILKDNPYLSLRLETKGSQIKTLLDLSSTILQELDRRKKLIVGARPTKKEPLLTSITFFKNKVIHLYKRENKEKTLLEKWSSIYEESLAWKKGLFQERAIIPQQVGGNLSGSIKLEGPLDNLSIKTLVSVTEGHWKNYHFDQLFVDGLFQQKIFYINNLALRKSGGELNFKGYIHPEKDVDLTIVAQKMPVDVLSAAFDLEKPFSGKLNLKTQIKGSLPIPNISSSFEVSSGSFAGVNFDRILGRISHHGKILYLHKLEFTTGNQKASLVGHIPFDKKDEIDVIFDLKGENIGLITSFSPDMQWVKGKGSANLAFSGTVNNPRINGYLYLNNAAMDSLSLKSRFEEINVNIEIKDNVVTIGQLESWWRGERTKGKSNYLGLKGKILLSHLFQKNQILDLDLTLADSHIEVDFPQTYSGNIILKNFSLKGPLILGKHSSAPQLSGTVTLSNGTMILPRGKAQKMPFAPIALALNLTIGKNVDIVGGDTAIISTDFSNLLLNLEVTGKDIEVSGLLTEPSLKGEVNFNRGTVNVFNREFTLLTPDRQRIFDPVGTEPLAKNTAAFRGGTLPYLDLAAEVKVKTVAEDGEATEEEITVVTHIRGIPYVEEKERGISMHFKAFREDKMEIVPAPYSEQQIKVMLLPDFIKDSLGISKKKDETPDTYEIMVDYLNRRLQATLLRGIERELEQSLGLERLTLEYNFGRDIERALPGERREKVGEKKLFGVGFVKGFFNRLYIDVRYAQAQEEQTKSPVAFNYQMTLKLSNYISLLYYREPANFEIENNSYYKYTLRASYPF